MQPGSPFSDDPIRQDSSRVPTGMENDPHADEEIIDQRKDEPYPESVEPPVQPPKIVPDDLAASIAYALDGSGPGPTNDPPNVPGHKTITEGMTGAGPDDEEDSLNA